MSILSNRISERVPLPGETGGQHFLAALVDHEETYGPRIIERFVTSIPVIDCAVDLGAGHGRDLRAVKRAHPAARTIGIDASSEYASELERTVDHVYVLDIERAPLPFPDCSVGLIIANQVLEHTKEIFWIFHEISRSLRVGGHVIIGVPNLASLHNRLLLLLGSHPTQHKLCSAHVRPFSKVDTLRFLTTCFPGGYRLEKFAGSQFYPFPGRIARALARIFPTGAFSIFFLLRKLRDYSGEFASYPARAHFETNFWSGDVGSTAKFGRQR